VIAELVELEGEEGRRTDELHPYSSEDDTSTKLRYVNRPKISLKGEKRAKKRAKLTIDTLNNDEKDEADQCDSSSSGAKPIHTLATIPCSKRSRVSQ